MENTYLGGALMGERTCSVEGCERASLSRGMCGAHYDRFMRNGDPGPAEIAIRYPPDAMCSVDGCERRPKGRGLCPTHWRRWRKWGDPTITKPITAAWWNRPEDHPRWKNDGLTYKNVHDRLRLLQGNASDHACAHCGSPAAHWAYDHEDPDERIDDRGCAYSTDPDRYMPLCVSCHWRFDGAAERLRKVT